MTDPRLLSIKPEPKGEEWWHLRVLELIRSLEVARDELYARNSVGARIINDQIAGIRAEIAAKLEQPRPSFWQRVLRQPTGR